MANSIVSDVLSSFTWVMAQRSEFGSGVALSLVLLTTNVESSAPILHYFNAQSNPHAPNAVNLTPLPAPLRIMTMSASNRRSGRKQFRAGSQADEARNLFRLESISG